MADFDPARFKREERAGYNLIAGRYAAGSGLRAGLNAALLDAADLQPAQRVLDLASGPGVIGREAAARIGGGLVVASDIAERCLREGWLLSRAEGAGDLLFAAADAERLCFPQQTFDRVLCGLGLMFFPDVDAALGELRRVLKPGGRAVFSVWGVEQRAPLVSCATRCIGRLLSPPRTDRPTPFRFGAPHVLRQAIAAAGFSDILVEPHPLHCAFASPADYWQAFRDLAGGAALALSRLPQETLDRLALEVGRELAPFRQEDSGRYLLRSEFLIATALA